MSRKSDYSKCSSLKQTAELAWFTAFNRVPYTNCHMIDELLTESKISYEQFLQNPKLLRQNVTEANLRKVAEYMDSHYGDDTFCRCTSFATEVVASLVMANEFTSAGDFESHDMGRHRLAISRKSGLVIDSASKHGSAFLAQGEWPGEWKDSNDKMDYQKWFSGSSGSISRRLDKNNKVVKVTSVELLCGRFIH